MPTLILVKAPALPLFLLLLVMPACAEPGELVRATELPSSNDGASNSSNSQDTWLEMLNCSLRHDVECQGFLRSILASPPSEAARNLADTLLEEWDLPLSDPRLARPRLIWVTLPDSPDLEGILPRHVDWSIIVVSGVVQADGRVEGAQLFRESSYRLLNEKILEVFSQARYRPARVGAHYVARQADYVYRLEPR